MKLSKTMTSVLGRLDNWHIAYNAREFRGIQLENASLIRNDGCEAETLNVRTFHALVKRGAIVRTGTTINGNDRYERSQTLDSVDKENKVYYKDFETGKQRYTKGDFAGWTKETGLLNRRYAIFKLKSKTLFIPDYCLSPETKQFLQVGLDE